MSNAELIIRDFNEMLQEGKIKSANHAATAMGISSSRLSQFLKGEYNGKIQETADIVKNFIQLMREREQTAGDSVEFVNIKNADKVLNLCRLVHVQKTIGIVTSRSGLGKTEALTKYADEHNDVIYIEVDAAYSPRELLSELNVICGYSGKGHLNKLKKEVIVKLRGTGRTIIIDQFEYLNDKALDLLRTIHDKAGIGLVLAGLPKGLENIKGVGGVHEQIYTRVGVCVSLTELGEEDIKALTQSFIPGSNGTYKDFMEPCRKNARVLRILCRESKRIAKNMGISINPDIIARAHKQLIKVTK